MSCAAELTLSAAVRKYNTSAPRFANHLKQKGGAALINRHQHRRNVQFRREIH